jgi:hypothetical protein
MMKVLYTFGAAAIFIAIAAIGVGFLHIGDSLGHQSSALLRSLAVISEAAGIIILFWVYRLFGRLEEDLTHEE